MMTPDLPLAIPPGLQLLADPRPSPWLTAALEWATWLLSLLGS